MSSVVARWRELRAEAGGGGVRVRLLGTFTLDTFVPHVGTALADLGILADVTVGPYNRIVPECLDPHSETALADPDVLVVWPGLESLWGEPAAVPGTEATRTRLLRAADDLADAVAHRSGRRILVLPAIPPDRPLGAGDPAAPHGVVALANAARRRLAQRAAETGMMVCDAEDVVRTVGTRAAYDHRLEALAAIPYTSALFSEAGRSLARVVRLGLRSSVKAVVVDGDGTLWSGAVGELGATGVAPADHLDFQRYLLGLRAGGVLLVLCSKNVEEDVWAVLDRPDMVLKREHLSAWRIGWRAKHVAVEEIAAELSIAVEDLVLIDDNPAELAEAQAALPALRTVRFPADPPRWREAVTDPAFDRLPPTHDDLVRPLRLEQDRHRTLARRGLTREEYLGHLEIWASCSIPSTVDIPRLAQLVLRVNQMNLNGRRPSRDELARLCASQDHEVRLIESGDRYGDYGLVGLLVVSFTGCARLELFLLSCRALGRDVERMMLAQADALARARGHGTLTATVQEMPRNEPARRLFGELGCAAPGQEAVLTPVACPSHVQVRQR
ncbi:HAD-IIIC family phosphatase [Lentzea sp. DG1S-22]|uniref:HAD-IIIC family phosphatase n=1 Tax=Lentzea sp. DG1S-22 TaxID=3108822 RepID=UPI002E79B003|nr:HAD-IIIC family phosphatase [Lentzea sp. DG1S-22]WVH82419.1 HAD-IIIC family phosphatase [Lentzea sp. DG1S-22]